MSLFERIKYKRYDLQEKKKTTSSSASSGNNKPDENISTGRRRIRKAISDLDATQPKIETGKTTYNKNKNVSQDIGQRRTAQSNQQQIFNRQYDAYDDGDLGNPSQTKSQTSPRVTTGKGVNQADVSKQAQEFTKKVNKERIVKQKNIFGGEDDVKTKRRVGSGRPRGTRTKTPAVPGQQKLNLGGDVTKKTPTPRLSKSGEVVTDLRTIGRKPRKIRKRSPLAKPNPPEKMVVAKDPVKGGFRKVGATTKQGREVLKKQFVSTDELLGSEKKIAKNNKKTNLFSKVKSKIKGFHNYMVKDAGFRKTASKNLTRNTFKNTIAGNTLKNINKVLPGKYKALAALGVGAYVATRGKKKDSGGGAGGGKTPIKPTISRKSINLSKPEKPNA